MSITFVFLLLFSVTAALIPPRMISGTFTILNMPLTPLVNTSLRHRIFDQTVSQLIQSTSGVQLLAFTSVNADNSIVSSFSFWIGGPKAAAELTAQQVRTVVMGWSNSSGALGISILSSAASPGIYGIQGTGPYFATCSAYNVELGELIPDVPAPVATPTPAPGYSCESTLDVTFVASTPPVASEIPSLLCSSLGNAGCSAQIKSFAGPTNGVYTIQVLISGDAAQNFVSFLNKITASPILTQWNIGRVMYGNTPSYVAPSDVILVTGTMEQCLARLWWLLFLLLIVPISYVLLRQSYRRGKLKGYEDAAEFERQEAEKLEVLKQQTVMQARNWYPEQYQMQMQVPQYQYYTAEPRVEQSQNAT